MFQMRLPDGKTPDNWYNVQRDIAHVFDKIVAGVVTSIPEDAVVPKPDLAEVEKICDTFAELFTAVTDPNETLDTVVARLDKLPPAFRAVFERELTINLFKRFTKGKREITGERKPVVPDAVQ